MKLRTWALAAIVAAGCALPASAQEQSSSSDRILQDFGKCRATTEAAARLACFEKTLDSFEQAVKTKQVRIVDRADMRKAKRSLFGFTLPKIDLFGGGRESAEDQADAFTEINTTVASARSLDGSRAEIVLADESGAVWRTTDPMPFPPKAGQKIRIRAGTLGNYFLSVDGKSYRGMRVR